MNKPIKTINDQQKLNEGAEKRETLLFRKLFVEVKKASYIVIVALELRGA